MSLSSKRTKSGKKTDLNSERISLAGYDGIEIVLKYKLNEDGTGGIVIGHAIHEGTSIRVDGSVDRQRNFSPLSKKSATNCVIEKVKADCSTYKLGAEVISPNQAGEHYFSDIFKNCVNIGEICSQNWGRGTSKQTKSYFRKFMGLLDACGPNPQAVDMLNIYDELIKRTVENKNSQNNPETAKSTVSKSMYRCKKLYEIICFDHPEHGLPHLEFPELATTNHQMEQAKALPDSVRVKLVYCLLTLAKQGNPLAFAAAVMFYFGLRTAEAAAVLIGDFKICGNSDYVTYHVLSQIRSDGTADIVLKTDSAYRTTIATHEMIAFIELRINQLKEKGMSESDMQKVPFASPNNQPGAFVSTIKLSEFILNLLLDCGCSKDYISYARELQSAYPDSLDEKGRSVDLSAYILRRDWITRACAICGIKSTVVDELVGHKKSKGEIAVIDLNNPDVQIQVARALTRYTALPEYTRNPAIHAIDLSGNQVIIMNGNGRYLLRALEDVELTIDLHTMEPNDIIRVLSSGILSKAEASVRPDDSKTYSARTVIGQSHDMDYYGSILNDAKEIDLLNLKWR